MAAVDVERIIQCIKDGDQDGVQARLKEYNTEYAECFFYNVEEKERRKQRELEEFRRNKVREYVPDSDSDLDADESEDPELILRRRLAAALIWFIRTRLQPGVLKRPAAAREEDRDVELYTYISEISVSALRARSEAKPGSASPDASDAPGDDNAAGSPSVHCATAAETPTRGAQTDPAPAPCSGTLSPPRGEKAEAGVTECRAGTAGHGACENKPESHAVLARGKRDAGKERGEEEEEEEEGEDDMEVWRKEAMKALCNVIYNSQKAQERASTLRLLSGLSERLKRGTQGPEPPSGQFYDLRLLFLLTALRPELRSQLQKERGVSLLTAALEQCLEVQWGEGNEVLRDPTAPPVSKEVSQRAMEILKTLFNITYNSHRQQPNEEDAALYRRLAAVLHHCLLLLCDGEERTEELQGHTVNVLSALPLQCLDVLLSVRLSEGSREWEGVNMDCVHALLLFMEKRLDRGHKLKEKLTPVLNLLTESCRAHRETRHYLKQQILPPLRDVTCRPEQGPTVRGRLVRLMTHVDTDVKQCSAELLFVLCKENVSRFVKYTGYGNAAGLLARAAAGRGGRVGARTPPGPRYSSDSDSDTEEYREAKGRINPVTGRVEEAQPDPMAGMTEEEKEEEACKLINMFNRLSRDNIIQPMGVTADGRLAPLCGQMRDVRLAEERESEEESDEVD
ncbi:hypothetical protein ANANG_G00286820 [Anguilla anguilla]|uniref:Synembryn n=1 Tax=Anguilla anguilla TaxID=7936 RepID=A0A9D3RIW5_ANGAN|nr:hypothetical protein ANANG_G00286820 [Anguilla anguilla]